MSRRSRKNIGLIGLGIIGRRVAENLRKRGFQVYVWNRTPRPVPNFVGSAAEVAELCQLIQLFVSDDEALLETVQQLSPALNAHHVVAAHCTVSPATMLAAAENVQRRGARFLDAPFTGSKVAAEKGELIYYVAGDDGALQQVRPFLEASSKEIVEFSVIGEATLLKVATNMVTAASVQSVAEALTLVIKCGVAPQELTRALRSNASHSGTLALKLPKMMRNDFEPHFSVRNMLKDLQIAARLAESLNLDFTLTEAALDGQLEQMKQGHGEDDYSSVARKFFPEGMPKEEEVPEEPEKIVVNLPEAEPEPAPASAAARAPAQTQPEDVAASAPTEAQPDNVAASAPVEAQPENVVASAPAEAQPEQAVVAATTTTETADPEVETPTPKPAVAEGGEEKRNFFERLFRRAKTS